MKRLFFFSIVVLLNISSLLIAQGKKSFGINTGMAIPSGNLSDTQEIGFEVGGIGYVATENKYIMIVIGISYTSLPGKEEVTFRGNMKHTHIFADFEPLKISLGSFIGKEYGLYLLPTINGNFEDDWTRFGFDLSPGYLLPLWPDNIQLNIAGKFSMMNVVRKNDEEKAINTISIVVGVTF